MILLVNLRLRITTFWNGRDLAQSFEKNEKLAQEMVDQSVEFRKMQESHSINASEFSHNMRDPRPIDAPPVDFSHNMRDPRPIDAPPVDFSHNMRDPRPIDAPPVEFSHDMRPRETTLSSLQERARRLQNTATYDTEPLVRAQLEDVMASDPLYAVPAVGSAVGSTATPSEKNTRTMTLYVNWVSLRRTLPQHANMVQLVVEYATDDMW